MIKISIVIITLNEEDRIGNCIDSVKEIADEILVIDSFSSDQTQQIVAEKKGRFIQNKFEGYIQQKNFGVGTATYDYILSLDADEVLDKRAQQEILRVKENWNYSSYTLNRLTNYCGKWIKHCGWYPDKQIRLFDRRRATWGELNPHARIELDEEATNIRIGGNILHYSFPSISSHATAANNYSEIAAMEAVKNGKEIYFIIHVILNPSFTFIKKFFFQLGFLDGFYGFVICILSAHSNFLKYTKIWQLKHENSNFQNG